jgi:AraC-like DNA-binding protein
LSLSKYSADNKYFPKLEYEQMPVIDPLDQRRIMAIDCCKHVMEKLQSVRDSHLLSVAPREAKDLNPRSEVDLITVGIARYPVRRHFISQLRTIYPTVPVLVLRREQVSAAVEVRAEFVLSDLGNTPVDCEMVSAVREVMPFASCEHLEKNQSYDTVRTLVSVLTESYADPGLDLNGVARKIAVSPKRLSLILNQEVGVSFRDLLRHVRLEQAKRMLRTHQYSVKEVAANVGFTDSHYFSRTFKEFTGQNAGEYQDKTLTL